MRVMRIERPKRPPVSVIHELPDYAVDALVAYFVFEWRKVIVHHDVRQGEDQTRKVRTIPQWCRILGRSTCVAMLSVSPAERGPEDEGLLGHALRTGIL
jgi:hypothetical protein